MSHPSEPPTTHEIGRRTYVVAEVDPLDVDGVRTVAVGTGLWLVLFLALLPFWSRLQEDDHLWWLWTCLAGFGLGLAGWDFCRRRRSKRLDEEHEQAWLAEQRELAEANGAPVVPTAVAMAPIAPPSALAEPVTVVVPVPEGSPVSVPPTPVESGVPPAAARQPRQMPPFLPR